MTDLTENVAKNVANENSQDLTEQWKKGELPSGEYYIIDDLGLHTTDRYYPSHGFCAELPQAVLAPVPSYDEWKASYNCMLENEVLRLKNAQLKELLEECRPALVRFVSYDDSEENARILLMNKINEVLK